MNLASNQSSKAVLRYPMKSVRSLFIGELLLAALVFSTTLFAQTQTQTNDQKQNTGTATTIPQSPTSQPAATPPSPSAQPADQTAPQDSAAPQDSSSSDSSSKDSKSKDKLKNVKPGSEKDVDAIGNRDMGKRGLGNWYALEKGNRMGKEYAQQIEQSAKLVQDPVINEYVNRIGQNLVRNSDAKVPFTIKVIDSDEINAFALPGGFFYVNSGLILAADEEAELAGVMAHEIAHVAARHAMREMTRGNILQISSIPLIFIGGGIGYGIQSAASLALPLTFLSFSRSFEAEADYLG